MGSGADLVVGRVSNATPYAPYVQHPEKQARVHRGRWQTTDEIVAEHEGDVAEVLEESAGRIVERMGD